MRISHQTHQELSRFVYRKVVTVYVWLRLVPSQLDVRVRQREDRPTHEGGSCFTAHGTADQKRMPSGRRLLDLEYN